ncbi:aminotransferase III [Haematobacter massiliensis]|uniref:Aminotransferase class III n=1 Tax=Haematobacter massiliensis TaxID=195105 RepID=A0A086Y5J1_9RHOB|nr:aminotransferase class III-fold pyridoxal phosphate-dependent enzyme [Haematobacter massiliensis]KFI29541.1 aminotransferase class III [Haematobacter massiliensis]OWJ70145.1 aminotransferase III [Haematobacter massiliensis]OWJ88252.1 aminotransferase III [Haematobacter massiliensis]QBJ25606.1 aminotransferase class III-fold pyridoxal phosphate-dependent enzyme [Haematobacter massiliensis]
MSFLNPARSKLLEIFALNGAMVRGSGARLFDENGEEYLDFLSQYGALPFGHNPERGWAALRAAHEAQIPSLIQPLHSAEAERLAKRLAEVTPGDLSITTLANSGAETVEAAIKLARIRTGRALILSTRNGFHGKTLGALSATGKSLYQQGFNAPAPDFDYVPYGDLDALEARLVASADGIAAFIFEPIQGEGGVVCPPEDYAEAAIALCRKHGVLTILDEIQTGLGRTGQLFACSHFKEAPDMLLLSKALGGGLMPIGACIVRPSAWDDRFGRLHSSTFANNALAATVACATLDQLLEDDQALIRRVAENGTYIRARLEALQRAYPDVIREVRGRGYMLGLEFQPLEERRNSAIMAHAGFNGGVTALIASYLVNVQKVLTAPLFNDSRVLRLQPPLILGRDGLDKAVAALEAVCRIIHENDYYALVRHLVARKGGGDLAEAVPQAATQPASVPKGSLVPGRFGFVIHYTEDEDIFRSDASLRQFSEEELTSWKAWVKGLGAGIVHEIPDVTSRAGKVASGWLLSVPMLPGDMRGKGKAEARQMIADAVAIAGEQGACRVGLGAFTSIVTRGGETVTGSGVPITSGNTLTTVSAVKAVTQICRRTGIALEDAHVVVVGASGAIGRLGAMLLARRAGRMTLVGNARNPFAPRLLSKVADDILSSLARNPRTDAWTPGRLARSVRQMDTEKAIHVAPKAKAGYEHVLSWTTDLEPALADADVVLVATSSDTVLVDPRRLKPGTLVCDVARPPNVQKADLRGTGVLVFDGGLVRPPGDVDLGPFQTLPANIAWGCLSETMLLALSGQERDFSIGSTLTLADADLLSALAEEHGFEPAPAQWYGDMVTEAAINAFAAQFRRKAVDRVAGQIGGQVGGRSGGRANVPSLSSLTSDDTGVRQRSDRFW